MSTTERRLREAIAAGEVLSVVYLSPKSSQPGSKRDIRPLRIEGRNVIVHCYGAGGTRRLAMRDLRIVGFDHPAPEYVREGLRRTEIEIVAAIVGPQVAALPFVAGMSERALTLHRPGGDGRVIVGIGKRAGPGRSPWRVLTSRGERWRLSTLEEAAEVFVAAALDAANEEDGHLTAAPTRTAPIITKRPWVLILALGGLFAAILLIVSLR